jgi:3-phenylpropionate/trans-cinnamate dioxygenase ferredoxin subunit
MTGKPTDAAAERDLLADVEQAIADLKAHSDPSVRDAVDRLLEGIDAVHRAGLSHLVQAIQGMTGDTLINRLIADPAIRLLLMSYDLIAVDRRLRAEEALDTVRGHLHDHGVDVEILEVVGGVVYVRLHFSAGVGEKPSTDAVRADIESALSEYLIGFQELEFRDREPSTSAVVPLDSLRTAGRPVYHDAMSAKDLADGTMCVVTVRDTSVLFARVANEVYAIRNQCGDSPLPLDVGTLEGSEIRCSWHGCRYDVRSGRRLDGDGRTLVLPTRVDGGRILVAVDVSGGVR